jgi:cell wall assembly regulator SMI1
VPSLTESWNSFWHTMTSKDRHANHDSPYRTGQHMPINQNRHAPLTSIATSAVDSHPDLPNAPYNDDSKRPSISSTILPGSPLGESPRRPYSPGMRSMSSPKIATTMSEEIPAPGEIQMQSFADGAPPPPPVTHSWRKIDRWAEQNYEELWDQLGQGCTQNDMNELEHELDISLPQDVRESLGIHDGQERGGRPTGIIFGCMLLDCEEIVQEWKNWKLVNEEYLSGAKKMQAHYPIKGLSGGASSSSSNQNPNSKYWREELLDRQESQPPKAIQKAYAHPNWISLARDWGGNNIAVDLAPGPTGKWGQVILFGRDYDCKYVIARSWAHFLATVADDIQSDKVIVDEETQELKLKEFKTENVEPAYMDILRWRADQKYGRRGAKRKSHQPSGLNTNVSSGSNGRGSPYNSPTVSNEDRGRSPQRFSRGPNGHGSPRHQVGSPLARVQEEIAHPQPMRPAGDVIKDFAAAADRPTKLVDAQTPIESRLSRNKLVDVPTPIAGSEENGKDRFPVSNPPRPSEDKENVEQRNCIHNSVEPVKVVGLGVNGSEDDMKEVTI